MKKNLVILGLFIVGIITGCATQADILIESTTTSIPTTKASSETTITNAMICDPVKVGATEVLYEQDFSNPTTSWDTIEDESPAFSIKSGPVNGVYQFTGLWFQMVDIEQNFPQDIIMELDIQFLGEIDQAEQPELQQQVSISFRQKIVKVKDGDYFYTLNITSNGYAWIEKNTWKKDEDVFLTDIVKLNDPQKINSFDMDGINQLRIDIIEDVFTININGKNAFAISDTSKTNKNTNTDTNANTFYITILAKPTLLEMGIIPSETIYDIQVDNYCVYKP